MSARFLRWFIYIYLSKTRDRKKKGALVFLEISTTPSNRCNKESWFVAISGKKTMTLRLTTNHVLQNPYKQKLFFCSLEIRDFSSMLPLRKKSLVKRFDNDMA